MFPRIIYNHKVGKKFFEIIKSKEFDIVHIHNFWPLISPSILFVCNKQQQPWVQTVHNYRYIVPDAILFLDDLSDNYLSIQKRSAKCFRNSYTLTFLYKLTAMLIRKSNVMKSGYGKLIVLNKFGFNLFSQIFDKNILITKGNFIPDNEIYKCLKKEKGDFYLYLGRLSPEKGVDVLLESWDNNNSRLLIAGTGPEEEKLKYKYRNNKSIEFVGFIKGEKKYKLLAEAKSLIVPSIWHETFGLIILEAFYSNTPVIASKVGGIPDLIEEMKTGILFEAGNVSDLSEKLKWCEEHPKELKEMGKAGRLYAEENFSESKNYLQLMNIYSKVISKK